MVGPGKIEGPYDAVSVKLLKARERETSYSKGGKVLYIAHSSLSKDGKTFTNTVKGTNSAGQTMDAVTVYDKQ